MDSFSWLPIGYMIACPNDIVPTNFIEVDGQRLSKTEYGDVFDILRGNVIDNGDTFLLPKKETIQNLFSNAGAKIILRLK